MGPRLRLVLDSAPPEGAVLPASVPDSYVSMHSPVQAVDHDSSDRGLVPETQHEPNPRGSDDMVPETQSQAPGLQSQSAGNQESASHPAPTHSSQYAPATQMSAQIPTLSPGRIHSPVAERQQLPPPKIQSPGTNESTQTKLPLPVPHKQEPPPRVVQQETPSQRNQQRPRRSRLKVIEASSQEKQQNSKSSDKHQEDSHHPVQNEAPPLKEHRDPQQLQLLTQTQTQPQSQPETQPQSLPQDPSHPKAPSHPENISAPESIATSSPPPPQLDTAPETKQLPGQLPGPLPKSLHGPLPDDRHESDTQLCIHPEPPPRAPPKKTPAVLPTDSSAQTLEEPAREVIRGDSTENHTSTKGKHPPAGDSLKNCKAWASSQGTVPGPIRVGAFVLFDSTVVGRAVSPVENGRFECRIFLMEGEIAEAIHEAQNEIILSSEVEERSVKEVQSIVSVAMSRADLEENGADYYCYRHYDDMAQLMTEASRNDIFGEQTEVSCDDSTTNVAMAFHHKKTTNEPASTRSDLAGDKPKNSRGAEKDNGRPASGQETMNHKPESADNSTAVSKEKELIPSSNSYSATKPAIPIDKVQISMNRTKREGPLILSGDNRYGKRPAPRDETTATTIARGTIAFKEQTEQAAAEGDIAQKPEIVGHATLIAGGARPDIFRNPAATPEGVPVSAVADMGGYIAPCDTIKNERPAAPGDLNMDGGQPSSTNGDTLEQRAASGDAMTDIIPLSPSTPTAETRHVTLNDPFADEAEASSSDGDTTIEEKYHLGDAKMGDSSPPSKKREGLNGDGEPMDIDFVGCEIEPVVNHPRRRSGRILNTAPQARTSIRKPANPSSGSRKRPTQAKRKKNSAGKSSTNDATKKTSAQVQRAKPPGWNSLGNARPESKAPMSPSSRKRLPISDILEPFVFILTSIEGREVVRDRIISNGGRVIEAGALSDLSLCKESCDQKLAVISTDNPKSKPKLLVALACGVPVLHKRWIDETCRGSIAQPISSRHFCRGVYDQSPSWFQPQDWPSMKPFSSRVFGSLVFCMYSPWLAEKTRLSDCGNVESSESSQGIWEEVVQAAGGMVVPTPASEQQWFHFIGFCPGKRFVVLFPQEKSSRRGQEKYLGDIGTPDRVIGVTCDWVIKSLKRFVLEVAFAFPERHLTNS